MLVVKVAHALYHRHGTWFGMLQSFPGALMDPYGYIVFETSEEYHRCEHLSIDTNRRVSWSGPVENT